MHGGKVIALLGAIVSVGVAIAGIVDGWNPAASVLAGLVSGFVAMNFLGTAERYWSGRKVKSSGIPGGGNVNFKEEVATATAELNRRVTDQMQDVNQRLYDLEREIFKRNEPGNERGE